MPFAILRFAKRKGGSVGGINRHNEREKEAYKSNKDIDSARTPLNYHIKAPAQSYGREIGRLIAHAGCKRRRDSVVMVETVVTASPEFLHALPPQAQQEYFQRAFDFLKERVGEQNILSAVVHMDEKTPHMHLSFCPITKDNRLAAKDILGNPKQLSQWQTDYHTYMSTRWSELERGASAMETGRKHIPVWLYKKAERLDEKAQGIEAALTNIGAFNAGKKRDAALALLKEWVPEAQAFTAQLNNHEAHIRSLEKALESEQRASETARGKAHEADQDRERIRNEAHLLKREYDRQKRLLARVPAEVLEQIKREKHAPKKDEKER